MRNVAEEKYENEIIIAGDVAFRDVTAMVKGLPYLSKTSVPVEEMEAKGIMPDIDLADLAVEPVYFGNIQHSYNAETFELKLYNKDVRDMEPGELELCTIDEFCAKIFAIVSKYSRISKVYLCKGILADIIKGSLSTGYYVFDSNDGMSRLPIVEINKDLLCKSRLYGKVLEAFIVDGDSEGDAPEFKSIIGDFVKFIFRDSSEPISLSLCKSALNYIIEVGSHSKVESDVYMTNEIFKNVFNIHNMNKEINPDTCGHNVEEEMIGDEDGDDSFNPADNILVHSTVTPTGTIMIYVHKESKSMTSIFVPGCKVDSEGEFTLLDNISPRECDGVLVEMNISKDEEEFSIYDSSLYECIEKSEVNVYHTYERVERFIMNILKYSDFSDNLEMVVNRCDDIMKKISSADVSIKDFKEYIEAPNSGIFPKFKDILMEIKTAMNFDDNTVYITLLANVTTTLMYDYKLSSTHDMEDIKRYAYNLVYNKYHYGNTKDMVLTENSVRHELEEALNFSDVTVNPRSN